MKYSIVIIAFIITAGCLPVTAQQLTADARQLITKLISDNELMVQQPQQVRLFYSCNQFKPAWLGKDTLWQPLLRYIAQAPLLGLHSGYAAYAGVRMAADTPFATLRDSMVADILLTDVAIRFFEDVLYGTHVPELGYNGLHYTPECFSVPLLLATSVEAHQFHSFLQQYENTTPPYRAVKAALAEWLAAPQDSAAASRVRQLGETLNTLRWLYCLQQLYPAAVVINIPSASLLLFNKDSIAMECRVIAGKKSTPTPLFTTCLSEVVLFPYWTVPHTIATRELLPMIKMNPRFLTANNFQILDSKGRIVKPAAINWQQLNARNFPYTIRQSTGCDNALGVVKFNFYTPWGVYLHDTPWKILFRLNKRFNSHGCIRVEKILPLAYQALPDKTGEIDTVLAQGQARHPQPVVLPVTRTLPVVVVYHTAWFDSAMRVQFYPDIYNKSAKK